MSEDVGVSVTKKWSVMFLRSAKQWTSTTGSIPLHRTTAISFIRHFWHRYLNIIWSISFHDSKRRNIYLASRQFTSAVHTIRNHARIIYDFVLLSPHALQIPAYCKICIPYEHISCHLEDIWLNEWLLSLQRQHLDLSPISPLFMLH